MSSLSGMVSCLKGALLVGAAYAGMTALGQQSKVTSVPDAQVESNVLQALAGNAQLASQTISSTAVYGTVTLSGAVPDEATRTLAEQVVSRTAGVKKVVDEMTLTGATGTNATAPIERGTPGTTDEAQPANANDGSNPYLQSDGSVAAPSAEAQQSAPYPASPNNQQYPAQASGDAYPAPQQQTNAPGEQPYPSNQGSNSAPPPPPSAYPAPPSAYPGPPSAYPPPSPYGRYPYPPQNAGSYQSGPAQPYAPGPQQGNQIGGQRVTIAPGAVIQVRTNEGLNSRSTPVGSTFTGVVLNDVIAGGSVAIPRGAQVVGVVSNATASGVLKGRGELALQLTGVSLAGQTYPLVSDTWAHAGGDKTLRTVDSALGLGALGAVIGGVAGGGAGAAIGAGVGGAAGIGASAASQGGQIVVPAEAMLTFHLTQPADVTTVSQAELNRLGAGTPYPAGMRRRYPPPPPYAYGPGYPAYPGYYYRRYPYPYPY